MRAIWKGAVSFGLVSIAVKLYSATEEKDIRFHQVHRDDGGRIRYKRTCSICGEEVTYDDIAKGYDVGGGEIIVLTDDDFADLPLSTSRAIDVLEFVPAEQIDPIMYAKAYFLEPEGAATKPYVLLRDALESTDRVAVVKVALRQREQLATLRVRDGVMVLNTMLWPDEVRRPDFGFLDDDVQARPQELAMAGSLIESMAADFDPGQYTDDYRAALQEVIDAKVAGREVVQPAEPAATPSAAVDLMAALRASVDRARGARSAASAASADDPTGDDASGTDTEPTPITAARSAKASGKPRAKATSGSGSKSAGKTAATPAGEKASGRSGAGTPSAAKRGDADGTVTPKKAAARGRRSA